MMDTSEKYIEMCQMAPEVQSRWQPAKGDYYRLQDDEVPGLLVTESLRAEQVPSAIWFPRQDQLQVMLEANTRLGFMSFSHAIASHPEWFDAAETPEQFWLILLMRELYHKSWSGVIWGDITDSQQDSEMT